MKARIGIVGTGWVGASVAISILHTGVASELLLSDRRGEIAEGEAMDLAHGSSFYPAAHVRAAPLEELRDCDAVVVAAGRGGRPEESRLDLLRDNAATARSIGQAMRNHRGLLVVVTNPVDVLTHVVRESSGLPPERVIGTGTMLDTARLRHVTGRTLGLDPRSVHAQVIGEHGDSEVVLWSSAQAGGLALRSWPAWQKSLETRLGEEVRKAAYEIIRRKGATNHAIGLVTATLLRWMLGAERRIVTVSRVQTGALGLSDVALSLFAGQPRWSVTPFTRPAFTAPDPFGPSRLMCHDGARRLGAWIRSGTISKGSPHNRRSRRAASRWSGKPASAAMARSSFSPRRVTPCAPDAART